MSPSTLLPCLLVVACFTLYGAQAANTVDCTEMLQGYMDSIGDKMEDSITIEKSATLPLKFGRLIDITLTFNVTTITGLKNMKVSECQYDKAAKTITSRTGLASLDVEVKEYILDGTFMGNIPAKGDGKASFKLDSLTFGIDGTTSEVDFTDPKKPILQFSDATAVLDMKSWTIEMENLMPDTDLGPAVIEFLTVNGPGLVQELAVLINDSGDLVKVLNKLFPA